MLGLPVHAAARADHGDCALELLGHGVLLVLSAPCQLRLLAGQEHGRTIPLADISQHRMVQCGHVVRRH